MPPKLTKHFQAIANLKKWSVKDLTELTDCLKREMNFDPQHLAENITSSKTREDVLELFYSLQTTQPKDLPEFVLKPLERTLSLLHEVCPPELNSSVALGAVIHELATAHGEQATSSGNQLPPPDVPSSSSAVFDPSPVAESSHVVSDALLHELYHYMECLLTATPLPRLSPWAAGLWLHVLSTAEMTLDEVLGTPSMAQSSTSVLVPGIKEESKSVQPQMDLLTSRLMEFISAAEDLRKVHGRHFIHRRRLWDFCESVRLPVLPPDPPGVLPSPSVTRANATKTSRKIHDASLNPLRLPLESMQPFTQAIEKLNQSVTWSAEQFAEDDDLDSLQSGESGDTSRSQCTSFDNSFQLYQRVPHLNEVTSFDDVFRQKTNVFLRQSDSPEGSIPVKPRGPKLKPHLIKSEPTETFETVQTVQKRRTRKPDEIMVDNVFNSKVIRIINESMN